MYDWTVMIYMAADNDLDDLEPMKSEAIKDLKLIKKVGSSDRVSVLAQLDRAKKKKTPRYYLTRGDLRRVEDLKKDEKDDLGETNTGDPCNMIEFLDWGMRKYEARHYLVIMWGHGAGALDVDYLTGDDPPQSLLEQCYFRRHAGQNGNGEVRKLIESEEMKNLSTGDLFPHHRGLYNHLAFAPSRFSLIARDRAKLFGIDLPEDGSLDYLDNRELRFIFETIKERHQRSIDVLGMDACLMSMVEIGYQLRGLVDYMVGSQDLVPKEGFPYDKILKRLTDNPDIKPKELGVEIVEHYVKSFKAKYNPTLALCDLTKFNGVIGGSLAGAINDLAGTLLNFIAHKGADTDKARAVRAAILHARGRAQYFDVGDYVDIYHFCDLLEKYLERTVAKKNGAIKLSIKNIRSIQAACRRVKKHFDGPNKFVIASEHKGRPVRNSNGLSIYFPIKGMDPTYRVIDFVAETVWQKFIDTFVKQIQWLDFLQEFAHNTRTPFRLRIPKPLD
jgi:hypothetical protein